MRHRARLESGPLLPDAELRAFLAACEGEGGVVSFVGIARPISRSGAEVTGLFLDHYPGMTERSLDAIAADTADRFAGARVSVVHRCGHVSPGEAIVFAAAAAAHRREAFEAADYMMDRLKTEAAFWKREDRADGSDWIEPTEQDRIGRSRWNSSCPE